MSINVFLISPSHITKQSKKCVTGKRKCEYYDKIKVHRGESTTNMLLEEDSLK